MSIQDASAFCEVESNREAVKRLFLSSIDQKDYPLRFYHGTDRFVLNTSDEDRVRYTNAFKRYIQAVIDTGVEWQTLLDCCEGDNEETEELAVHNLRSIMNHSPNYEYRSLYVTSSLKRASEAYAVRARFFGEIGDITYHLRAIVKRANLTVCVDSEVDELLDEVFRKILENKPKPVILKLKPELGVSKIVSMEDGKSVDYIGKLKSYLLNWDVQASYRLDDSCTLDDFIEIDLDEEVKDMQRRSEKLRKEYQTYYNNYLIEAFGPITESEKRKLVLFGYLFEEE